MFCPHCGKAEQTPDSYCRSCGQFLADYSAKTYLVNKMLGGSSPRTQIKVSLYINFVTLLVSGLLLGFLNGHYDAQFEKTGQRAPRIIHLVYMFLGLVALWQVLGLVINTRLKSKLGGGERGNVPPDSKTGEDALPSPATQRSLKGADAADEIPQRAEQQGTTKILNRTPRE